MKIKRFIQLCTTLATLVAVAFVSTPTMTAAEKSDAVAKKAKQDQENLEKYDRNRDGKLDDEEKAFMKADQARIAAEKKEAAAQKKAAAAEKKAAAAEAKKEKAAAKKSRDN
jgi:hypothetical protein